MQRAGPGVLAKSDRKATDTPRLVEELVRVPKDEEATFSFKISRRLLELMARRASELGMTKGKYVRTLIASDILSSDGSIYYNQLPASIEIIFEKLKEEVEELWVSYQKMVEEYRSLDSWVARDRVARQIRDWKNRNVTRIGALRGELISLIKKLPRVVDPQTKEEIKILMKKLDEMWKT